MIGIYYLKSHEVNVLVEILLIPLHVLLTEFHLFLLTLESGWDEAMNPKGLTLLERKGHTL
jgi:hypothetical protein